MSHVSEEGSGCEEHVRMYMYAVVLCMRVQDGVKCGVREVSEITAGSLMVGTPINLVHGLISVGVITLVHNVCLCVHMSKCILV